MFVRPSALPAGTETLKSGTRVEFGIVQGRKGDQALQVRLLDAAAVGVEGPAQAAEDMITIVEDLIRLLDGLEHTYRRGRQPEGRTAAQTAQLLRALADELDA